MDYKNTFQKFTRAIAKPVGVLAAYALTAFAMPSYATANIEPVKDKDLEGRYSMVKSFNYKTKKAGLVSTEKIHGKRWLDYDVNKDKRADLGIAPEHFIKLGKGRKFYFLDDPAKVAEPVAGGIYGQKPLSYGAGVGCAVGDKTMESLNLYLKHFSGSLLAKGSNIGAALGLSGRTGFHNLGLEASIASINGATAESAGINADLIKEKKFRLGAGAGVYDLDNSLGAYGLIRASEKSSEKMCVDLEACLTSNDGFLVGAGIRYNFGQGNDSFFSSGYAGNPVAGSLLSLNEEKTQSNLNANWFSRFADSIKDSIKIQPTENGKGGNKPKPPVNPPINPPVTPTQPQGGDTGGNPVGQ